MAIKKSRSKRVQNKTSCITGEGKADRNFLEYLKSLYYNPQANNHAIKIYGNNNDGHTGGCAKDIMQDILCNSLDRDGIAILLDSDTNINGSQTDSDFDAKCRKICQNIYDKAYKGAPRQLRGQLARRCRCIFVSPCLEGLLLRILGRNVSQECRLCKKELTKVTGREAHNFGRNHYLKHFPKEILEKKRRELQELNDLLSYFELDREHFDAWFSGDR